MYKCTNLSIESNLTENKKAISIHLNSFIHSVPFRYVTIEFFNSIRLTISFWRRKSIQFVSKHYSNIWLRFSSIWWKIQNHLLFCFSSGSKVGNTFPLSSLYFASFFFILLDVVLFNYFHRTVQKKQEFKNRIGEMYWKQEWRKGLKKISSILVLSCARRCSRVTW